MEFRVPQSEQEWSALRELCCRTGNSGAPIERSRWPFFAEHWIGPYQRLLPEWTSVAVSEGQVCGYLTGCPDTRGFERAKFVRFHARLFLDLGLRRLKWNADSRRYVRRTLKFERAPNRRFDRTVLARISERYPAHLHVNVDEGVRGQGVGARLVTRFFDELGQRGVPGVHVFCGVAPVAFYKRLGFETLSEIEFQPTPEAKPVRVLALGASISTL